MGLRAAGIFFFFLLFSFFFSFPFFSWALRGAQVVWCGCSESKGRQTAFFLPFLFLAGPISPAPKLKAFWRRPGDGGQGRRHSMPPEMPPTVEHSLYYLHYSICSLFKQAFGDAHSMHPPKTYIKYRIFPIFPTYLQAFGDAQMTVAEATDIADNALEHTVRAVLSAVQVGLCSAPYSTLQKCRRARSFYPLSPPHFLPLLPCLFLLLSPFPLYLLLRTFLARSLAGLPAQGACSSACCLPSWRGRVRSRTETGGIVRIFHMFLARSLGCPPACC